MKPVDDWDRWGRDWQQQAVVDVVRLRRRTRRKQWQMRVVLAFELLAGAFAIGQLIRLWFFPWVDTRWRIWAVLAFALVLVVVSMHIFVRRGTWRATPTGIPDLLRLTAARARAGVRVAWLNIASFALLLALTLSVAAPWLAPSRWLHDASLRHVLLLQIGINGSVALVMLIFCVVYIRRQRQRLRTAETLLREYVD